MKHALLILALLAPTTAYGQRRHHHRRHHRERVAPQAEAAPAQAPAEPPAPPTAPEPPASAPSPAAATAPPPAPPPAAEVLAAQAPAPAPAAPLPNPFIGPSTHRFAVELGPVLGVGVSTSGLGVGPEFGAEVGGRLALGPGAFAFSLRGTWSAYERTGTLAQPCAPAGSGGSNASPAPGAPCVSQPASGSYDYTLSEMLIRVSLPLSYRVLPITSAFNVYVGVAPTLTVQRAETAAFTQRTVENALRFGVTGFAGAQYRLGFGALFFEAGYAWAPVSHRATGEVPLGAVQLAMGYRLSIPSL